MAIVILEVKPLQVPLAADVFVPAGGNTMSVPLEQLSDDDFHALIEAWVEAVYAKARKIRPIRAEV